MARLVAEIDDDLHKKLKVEVAKRGLTVKSAIEQMIKPWLKNKNKSKAGKVDSVELAIMVAIIVVILALILGLWPKIAQAGTVIDTTDHWHRVERGWGNGIGYNFVIRQNAEVEEGRPLTIKGAHARTGRKHSRNGYVGIVLTGRSTFDRGRNTSHR